MMSHRVIWRNLEPQLNDVTQESYDVTHNHKTLSSYPSNRMISLGAECVTTYTQPLLSKFHTAWCHSKLNDVIMNKELLLPKFHTAWCHSESNDVINNIEPLLSKLHIARRHSEPNDVITNTESLLPKLHTIWHHLKPNDVILNT